MAELERCPFCGCEAELVEINTRDFVIECTKCHAGSRYFHRDCVDMNIDAIKAWNRRVAMADLIDREVVRDVMYHKQDYLSEYDLNDIPAVDAVIVVRCKDCKFFAHGKDGVACGFFDGLVTATEDDFCSYGKRKEQGDAETNL